MRYFSNFFEDRRMLTGSPSVGASYSSSASNHSYSGQLTLTEKQAKLSDLTNGNNTPKTKSDSFTTSNHFEILSAAQGGTNISAWDAVGATSVDDSNSCSTNTGLPRYADMSPAMRKLVDKVGDIPTITGPNGKVQVDREALIGQIVNYYTGPEGGSMNLNGFSAERFANANHDERMLMLRSMREQNDVAKAAKLEEDMRLAQERDKQKADQPTAAQTQQAQPNNTLMAMMQLATQALPMLF
jgi:hypothetical protein